METTDEDRDANEDAEGEHVNGANPVEGGGAAHVQPQQQHMAETLDYGDEEDEQVLDFPAASGQRPHTLVRTECTTDAVFCRIVQCCRQSRLRGRCRL